LSGSPNQFDRRRFFAEGRRLAQMIDNRLIPVQLRKLSPDGVERDAQIVRLPAASH
jgi:hypothetical protein